MEEIVQLWVINDLIIWAVYASFSENMIFENIDRGIRAYLYQRVKPHVWPKGVNYFEMSHYRRWKKGVDSVDYWLKPLYKCAVCMPSVWASTGFLIFADQPLYFWPVYVITMVGANYIISQLISKHISIDQ